MNHLPIRDVDTLRGISIPAQHTGSFSASATIPPAAEKSRTTALVIAMLGATLSLSVGFVAFGNGGKDAKAAAGTTTATTMTTPAPLSTLSTAVAEQRGKNATVIAPPPKAIPVGIVEVDAPKGSRVFVDDVLFGTAPIHVTAPMGLHTVRVESRSEDIVFGEDAQTAHFDAEPITARKITVVHGSGPRPTAAVRPAPALDRDREKQSKRPVKPSDLDQAKDLSAQAIRDLGNRL